MIFLNFHKILKLIKIAKFHKNWWKLLKIKFVKIHKKILSKIHENVFSKIGPEVLSSLRVVTLINSEQR